MYIIVINWLQGLENLFVLQTRWLEWHKWLSQWLPLQWNPLFKAFPLAKVALKRTFKQDLQLITNGAYCFLENGFIKRVDKSLRATNDICVQFSSPAWKGQPTSDTTAAEGVPENVPTWRGLPPLPRTATGSGDTYSNARIYYTAVLANLLLVVSRTYSNR